LSSWQQQLQGGCCYANREGFGAGLFEFAAEGQ
jgi:hypothetical protein